MVMLNYKTLYVYILSNIFHHNGSSGCNSHAEEIPGSKGMTSKVVDKVLFEEFEATFLGAITKEELAHGLKTLRANGNLLSILEFCKTMNFQMKF